VSIDFIALGLDVLKLNGRCWADILLTLWVNSYQFGKLLDGFHIFPNFSLAFFRKLLLLLPEVSLLSHNILHIFIKNNKR
jgi:O-antigen ligase